ncbi:MAG: hypothetical protein NC084_06485 [Bacteroides sp.]|nr:Hpt domain-containing protein [Eubacterium sp.]MCM1418272.1 Hpt domain-containing protein [Roseburia sp.]MCM1462345.1 hypothetical protein [Bacteroides sp.]
MQVLLEKLAALGSDIEDGMTRFMSNEALYVRCLKKFPPQAEKCTLHDDLARGDFDAAVQSAHAMKGVTGNLSLTPLFTRYAEIVDRIRAGEKDDRLIEIEKEIASLQEEICAVILSE